MKKMPKEEENNAYYENQAANSAEKRRGNRMWGTIITMWTMAGIVGLLIWIARRDWGEHLNPWVRIVAMILIVVAAFVASSYRGKAKCIR